MGTPDPEEIVLGPHGPWWKRMLWYAALGMVSVILGFVGAAFVLLLWMIIERMVLHR